MVTTLTDIAEGYDGENFRLQQECPICSGASKVLHPASNIDPKKPYRFDLRKCRQCGHAWISPMPSQELLDYLYKSGSPSVIGTWGAATLSPPEQLLLKREHGRPPGRYFELGVGKGSLYRQFVERGWECSGVDPGEWAHDLPNVAWSLSDVPPTAQADLLVALDVLEHIPDPVKTLRRLRLIASPGARLYCAMPNCESLRARVQRERWRMVRPLGHVNYWSRQSITRAMGSADFSVTWLRATDLWQKQRVRSLRGALLMAIELLGVGDQWIVMATAR